MIKPISKKVFIFLMLLLATSASFAQKNPKLSDKDQAAFDSYYMNGAREKVAQNIDNAIRQFKNCLLIDASNGAVYFNLAELYLAKKMARDARENVDKAVELDKENLWYRKLQITICEATGDLIKAAEVSFWLSKKETPVMNLLQASLYYEQARQYADAIKMLNKAEKIAGLNEEIVVRKEQLFLQQNKLEKAANEIKKLCKAYPENLRYQIMLAELYLVNDKVKEGVELYQQILKKDPANGYASFALADYYRNIGDTQQFFGYMKTGMASNDVDIKSKLRMMVLFMTSKVFNDNFTRSQILADIFIKTHPDEATTFLVKGDLFIEQGKFDAAHGEYQKAIDIDPSLLVAYQQMIYCSNRTNNIEAVKNDCIKAIEAFPNEVNFYLNLVFAQLQLKQYLDAVKWSKRGIEISGDDINATSQFYVCLGDAYHYLNDVNACDSSFESALKLDSNNAYALNNYAYFLSLRKIKLERAEQMSKRSLVIDPANPSYADTYGWILFQLGQYEKAAEYIKRSLDAEPGNTEVMDHLGDVFFKMGKKNDAIEQWKRAKEMGRIDEKLNKKIKDEKLYE